MKKNLLNWMAILMVTIMSVSFVSCGSDDDDKDGNNNTDPLAIVGTWVKFYEKETKWVLSNGNWEKSRENESSESGESALFFGEDGTYYKMTLDYNGNWHKGTIYSYSVQGNKLIITDYSSSKTRTFSISGTILEITETELDGYEKEEEVKRYRKM